MEVKHSKAFKDSTNHFIEWGYGTWSQNWETKDFAIRNRYNKDDGGFNLRGSAEISWSDFNQLIVESIKEKQFSNKELRKLLKLSFKQLIKNFFKK